MLVVVIFVATRVDPLLQLVIVATMTHMLLQDFYALYCYDHYCKYYGCYYRRYQQ